MLFLVLGLALLITKYMEVWPGVALSWWWVLSPFALAAAWWSFADATGFTKRKVMERENARRQERIDKNKANLGITPTRRK